MPNIAKSFLYTKVTDIPEIRKEFCTVVTLLDSKFPHISENICARWSTPSFHKYVESLLITERNDRDGLPFDVLAEVLQLVRIHDKYYPEMREKYIGAKITGY